MNFRATKMVITVGPASFPLLSEMRELGVEIFRINAAHVDSKAGREAIQKIRQEAKGGKILLDLAGPKIRVGTLCKEPFRLSQGDLVWLVVGKEGEKGEIPIQYEALTEDLEVGHRVFLADGSIQLVVTKVEKNRVQARVIHGGPLFSRKGVNFPDIPTQLPALTEKDKEDLKWGIEEGVDLLSLSFVRSAQDVLDLRKLLQERGVDLPIISKLEKPQALEHLEEILEVSDAVMVARGDLGIEVPYQEIGIHQKRILEKAREKAKPVITATQLLLSMVDHPYPSRAEVTDITHAVWEGTDALMLSDETTGGNYPLESVKVLEEVILAAEEYMYSSQKVQPFRDPAELLSIHHSIAYGAYSLAVRLGVKAILVPTRTGYTVRILASYRPYQPVLAFSPFQKTLHLLELCRGVVPVSIPPFEDKEKLKLHMIEYAKEKGFLKEGDRVVILGGYPERREQTSWMEVMQV